MDILRLVDYLFTPACVGCGLACDPGVALCERCLPKLPYLGHACSRCALPLEASPSPGAVCGQCLTQPPPFEHAFSLFEYRDDAAQLITQLKFHDRLVLARVFGQLLADRVTPELAASVDAVLPVPLHDSRLRRRGFNQSIELSKYLCRQWRLPMLRHEVERSRPTEQQTGLDAKQRRGNVRGAFRVVEPLGYRHIAIVDDVVTTGSTTSELARVLKRAGVETVSVWSIARAPR